MLKERIQILDVTYFLIDKFNYKRINVQNPDMDIWLVNNESEKFPIIRLSKSDLSLNAGQKNNLIASVRNVSKLFNLNEKILNIHFTDLQSEEIREENFKQALVNEHYISPLLEEEFKNIKESLRPIGDNLEKEFRKRELKLLDLGSKKQKRQKFSIKNVGPTQVLLFINLLVFIAATFIEIEFGSTLSAVLLGGLYKNFVYGANEWWRLITAGFLHVDLFHILMNMLVLMQIGSIVEKVYSKKQMIIIFMTSVLTSSLLALIMMDGGTISLGASGGVFGLLGAFIVYLISSDLAKIPRIRNQIVSTLIANVLISLIPGISFWGHLGGFIGGVLVAVAVSKAKKLKPAKIHAIISTVLIVVSMFAYSIFIDDNVYNIKPDIDKLTVKALKEVNLDSYANKLEEDMKVYYQKIGEDYE